MRNPIITVLMPVYNGEKYLREAIESILNQTFTDYEFLIINDGSTDKSEEIILSFKDQRIVYVKNEKNIKLIKTLNKGIKLARGKYIARMDADDISLPKRLEKELMIFNAYPDIDIVSVLNILMSEDGKRKRKLTYFLASETNSCKFVSLFDAPLSHPGVMVKTSTIKKYFYNDNTEYIHIEAFELWNRMLWSGCKCKVIKEYLIYYRDNNQSVSHQYSTLQLQNHTNFVKNIVFLQLSINPDTRILEFIKTQSFKNTNTLNLTLRYIDEVKRLFLEKFKSTSRNERKEINDWCLQKQIILIISYIINSNKRLKLQGLGLLLPKVRYFLNKTLIKNILYRL